MSMTSTDKAIFTGDTLIIFSCGVYYIWTDDTGSGMFWQPTGEGCFNALCHVGLVQEFVDGALWEFQLKETGDYHEEMDPMGCCPVFLLGPPLWWIMPCIIQHRGIKYWPQQRERLNWLQCHSNPCTTDLRKAELLHLVKIQQTSKKQQEWTDEK